MNQSEFLAHYRPLLGEAVKDNHFSTKKLTATAILNKTVELFYADVLSELYRSEDIESIEAMLLELLDIAQALGFEHTREWAKFDRIPHSIGNSKIGRDTLCISFNSGMLCYMGLTGQCSNCGICYANNSNKMYTKEFLKNTISQVVILKIMQGELSVHEVLRNTIYSINAMYSKPQLNRLAWLRLSVNGDILNNAMLDIIEALAIPIKNVFDLFGVYTYTHNQSLNIGESPIVFNCSDFKGHGHKTCYTKFKFDIDWLTSERVVLCNGNCNQCPYCKNGNEPRDVIFLAHGGAFEGIEAVPSEFIAYLDYNKANDYLELIRTLNGV